MRRGNRQGHAVAAGLGLCSALLASSVAVAQMVLPAAKPPDGATLFKQQCAVCHTTNASDPPRQGPSLASVVGRKAGTVAGFRYSSGFAQAGFIWDESRLDAWLTDPQAVIPGAIMPYRQARADIRTSIIAYLKELN
jgi:cytochrome c